MSIYKTAQIEQQETNRLNYTYTPDDYATQAAELGLCPKYSRTIAEMRMSSLQLSWDILRGREHSFKSSLTSRINKLPKSIKFGV